MLWIIITVFTSSVLGQKQIEDETYFATSEHWTQWLMCYAPPPGLSEREREMKPVLGSLAGLDSTAARQQQHPLMRLQLLAGDFQGQFSFEASLVCLLFFVCTGMSANKHAHSHP